MKKIRWGVLGIGLISRDYMIPALLRSPLCELRAFASSKNQPDDYLPGVRREESYESLLCAEDIDAIYVPVPNALHTKWSLTALHHGKHVLCEKPLTCTAEETCLLIEAAEKSGCLLAEAFMYRCGKRFATIDSLIRQGTIGEIHSMQGVHGYPLTWKSPAREDPALGGGCLYDVGCYIVDCMNYFMRLQGATLQTAKMVCRQQGGVDFNSSAVLLYDNGVVGSLACWFDCESAQSMLFSGTKGTILAPNLFEPGSGHIYVTTDGHCEDLQIDDSADAYQSEAEHFCRSILTGEPSFIPLTDSLRNAQALEQLYQ